MWWEILELSADADQKAIKQAYARKLKKTRPEDDPEGFQTLHQAYKQALDWSAHQDLSADYAEDEGWEEHELWEEEYLQIDETTSKNAPENAAPPQLVIVAPLKAPSLITNQLAPPEPPPLLLASRLEDQEDPSLAADWQQFQQQLSINIHSETARKNPKDWVFLEQLPSFIDLEFRARLSYELFGSISESNLKAAEQKTLFIKPPVLQYLNQLFTWDQQWRYFTAEFGEQQADAILLHLEANQPTTSPARVQPAGLHYYARIMAFIIDLAVVFILSFMINVVLEKIRGVTNSEPAFSLGLLIWLIAYPPVEASSWQASLGKKLMKLKVVNKQGQPLSLHHAYLRHLVTSACILGFKWVVLINILLAYKRTMLLQDWLTQSYVVKKI